MTRFPLLAGAWAVLLVVGFAVVLTLGTPLRTTNDEINAALHPAPPVSQADAERSADTIVRLGYPSFTGSPRMTTRATDFGIDHWLVEYTDKASGSPRGIRVSIVITTGHVEVSTYP